MPGVAASALNTGLHPLGNMWTAAEVVGTPPRTEPVVVHQINAGIRQPFGIRLAAGRLLSDTDVFDRRAVALVNERFVRDALRRTAAARPDRPAAAAEGPAVRPRERCVRSRRRRARRRQQRARKSDHAGDLPAVLAAGVSNVLVVRTTLEPSALTRAVVGQVYAIDSSQPVANVKTLDVLLAEDEFSTPRFNLILLSVFAAIGLVLAVVGVYGVMADRRRATAAGNWRPHGARRVSSRSIAGMVLTRGSRLLLLGMAIGLIGEHRRRAAAGPAGMERLAVRSDRVCALSRSCCLAAGLQACVWPALRAGRTDPIIALREE